MGNTFFRGDYKSFEASLRSAAEQWFKERGHETHPRMGYCLARNELWPQNLICEDVADYIRQEKEKNLTQSPFPLHKYLHHGLSSQAMAFNLIGPLIVRNDLAPLKIAIERLGIEWPGGEVEANFEHDDRSIFNEDSGQPTSIDILLSGSRNSLFIEAKLVEREFGGCSVFAGGDCEGRNPYPERLDECYLHHIGRTYWQRLDELGFSEASLVRGAICPFANYYQFFREATFAFARQGSFILLHDARNPAFLRSTDNGTAQSGLWPFLYEAIPQNLHHRVGRLTIQVVVEAIQESCGHEDWIEDFKKKYGLQ
jgi:hypothetical protein